MDLTVKEEEEEVEVAEEKKNQLGGGLRVVFLRSNLLLESHSE